MLSRTADNLYWIARYMERAETAARLLEVGARISLLPTVGGYRNDWDSLLRASGNASGYAKKYGLAEQAQARAGEGRCGAHAEDAQRSRDVLEDDLRVVIGGHCGSHPAYAREHSLDGTQQVQGLVDQMRAEVVQQAGQVLRRALLAPPAFGCRPPALEARQ